MPTVEFYFVVVSALTEASKVCVVWLLLQLNVELTEARYVNWIEKTIFSVFHLEQVD